MKWYVRVLGKYVVFTGRARRKEYWMFFLFNVIASIILTLIDMGVGTYDKESENGLFSTMYSLGVILPSIAVCIRRMHDVGKSGWYSLIPVYNLILACTDGDRGDNDYGSDPKAISVEE